jgi:hypothetical protein
MLLNSVQSREFLKTSAFKPIVDEKGAVVVGKEAYRRLYLRSQHHVRADIGGRTKTGSASVWYGLESSKNRTDPTHALTVDDTVPAVAVQGLSTIVSVMRDLGVRHAISGTGDYDTPLDMRSLAYVCGFVAASTACGIEPVLKTKAKIAAVSADSSLHLGTTCTFSETAFSNRDELVTLAYLVKAAGVDVLRISTQTAPSVGAKLEGKSLGVFALRVYANILAETHSVAASAIHAEAAFSGALASIKVLGHSYEGSGVRDVIKNRSYPTPVGFIKPNVSSFQGLSTVNNVHTADLLRYVISMVLSGVGRIARSDPTRSEEGLPTIYQPKVVTGKPSSLIGFEFDFYAMTDNWRKLAAKEDGLAVDDYKDGMSCKSFFNDDLANGHFKHKSVVPFFYVEPGPLSTSMESSIPMLGCQGQGRKVPLFKGAVGYKTAAYGEFNGTPFPGSVVRIVTRNGYHARANGINYLFSGRYTRENGLSQFNQVKFTGSGVMTDDMALSGDSKGNLAERRWHTYHCPLPNPGENFTSLPACFSYTYSGGTVEPTLAEFVNGEMDSLFGTLVVGVPGNKKSTYHRDVPDYLLDVVGQTAGVFSFLTDRSNMVDLASAVGVEGAVSERPAVNEFDVAGNDTGTSLEETIEDGEEREIAVSTDAEENIELPESSGMIRPRVTDGPSASGAG